MHVQEAVGRRLKTGVIQTRTIDGQIMHAGFLSNLGNTDVSSPTEAMAEILARMELAGYHAAFGPARLTPEEQIRSVALEGRTPIIGLYIDLKSIGVAPEKVMDDIRKVDKSTPEYRSMFEKAKQSLSPHKA